MSFFNAFHALKAFKKLRASSCVGLGGGSGTRVGGFLGEPSSTQAADDRHMGGEPGEYAGGSRSRRHAG